MWLGFGGWGFGVVVSIFCIVMIQFADTQTQFLIKAINNVPLITKKLGHDGISTCLPTVNPTEQQQQCRPTFTIHAEDRDYHDPHTSNNILKPAKGGGGEVGNSSTKG